MTKIDPEQERSRMARSYAAMSDEELQKAAAPAESAGLTVWAFEDLREEMRKRGLDWVGKDAHFSQDMERFKVSDDLGNRPVVLRRYRDMPAAFVEKSVLDAAGIDCFLQDDNVVRMDWLWSNAMGGIKLMVREKDAEEAERLLNQEPPKEQPDTDGENT